MRWFVIGCCLGALGALMKSVHWPGAEWASLAGIAVVLFSLIHWLNVPGIRRTNSGNSTDVGDTGVFWTNSSIDSAYTGSDSHSCDVSDSGCNGHT